MAYSLIISLVCMRLYCKGLYCIIAEVPGVARKIKKNVEEKSIFELVPSTMSTHLVQTFGQL